MMIAANIISMTILFAVPLLLVAMGGMFSEHSGVINIALEGMMIIGALFACFTLQGLDQSGFGPAHPQLSMFIAILVAGVTGMIFSLLLGFAAINLKADQTIGGTALNQFAPAFAVVMTWAIQGQGLTTIFIPNWVRITRDTFGLAPVDGPSFWNNLIFKYFYLTTPVAIVLFIAAYIRMVSLRPGINRFVAGRRIYARNNIEVVLTVRRSMSTTSNETTIKAVFAPTDTIFDVYRKMNEKIDEIKFGGEDNNTEQVAGALLKLPRFLLRFAIGCLRVMDYFGIIPQKLLDASPFHGSMIITDMGSLGIPPIYHHLYNFGNLPMFIAFGAKRKAVELDREGKPVERKYIDFMAVMDERVCDGYYYASSFKYMKMYMHNPALLEVPPEKVVEDLF